jgi:hypothetical protein
VLFDANYYKRQLPWFARSNADALEHYLSTGWQLGLSPHFAFDSAYLAQQLGVKAWGVPPLLAYFEAGKEVSAHPLFEPALYGRKISLVGQPFARLFELFITSWAEARAPFSKLFSVEFYSKFEPVLRYGSANPLLHYLRTDLAKRRDPNPMLHNRWYDLKYPAKVGQSADPLLRFAVVGIEHGHLPNPFAVSECALQEGDGSIPREILLEYVDVSEADARWLRALQVSLGLEPDADLLEGELGEAGDADEDLLVEVHELVEIDDVASALAILDDLADEPPASAPEIDEAPRPKKRGR